MRVCQQLMRESWQPEDSLVERGGFELPKPSAFDLAFARKAGYRHAFKTTNEFVRSKF